MTTALARDNRADANMTAMQYATFWVGDLYFGVDVLTVQEVLRAQGMTPVPLAPGVIEGLINLRGQIVTAIDMRRRLGLGPRPPESSPMNVILRVDDEVVSLLVDDIGDVIEAPAGMFEPTPPSVDESIASLIQGVYKFKGLLLLVLDTHAAADISNSAGPACGERYPERQRPDTKK